MPLRLFSVSNTVRECFYNWTKAWLHSNNETQGRESQRNYFLPFPLWTFLFKRKKEKQSIAESNFEERKKKKTSPLSQLFHPLHVLNTHVVPDSWKKKKKRPPGWSHVKDLRRKNCFKRKKRIKCLNLWRVRRERKKGTQGKKQRKKKRGCLSSWMALWCWNRGPVTFSSQPLSCLGASWHPSELKQLSGLQVSLKPRP